MIRYLRCAQVLALCALCVLYGKASAQHQAIDSDLNLHQVLTRPTSAREDTRMTGEEAAYEAQTHQDSRQLAIMRSPIIIMAMVFLLCLFAGLMAYSVWRMVHSIVREKERKLEGQRKPLLDDNQLMITVTDYDIERV